MDYDVPDRYKHVIRNTKVPFFDLTNADLGPVSYKNLSTLYVHIKVL
jgi:hypothetical protein